MVETYFNTELEDITFEVEKLDEWKELTKELGLENQLNLTKSSNSPIPFPYMNLVMNRVYETLCPRKVDYKEYKITPIPLEVLKMIKLAVNDNHFTIIEIWYDDKTPDPVVIGKKRQFHCYYKTLNNGNLYIKDDKSNYIDFDSKQAAKEYCSAAGLDYLDAFEQPSSNYLIARWGDELRDFSTLKKLAIERFLDNEGGEMKKDFAKLQERINILKENTVSYFNGNIEKVEVTGKW